MVVCAVRLMCRCRETIVLGRGDMVALYRHFLLPKLTPESHLTPLLFASMTRHIERSSKSTTSESPSSYVRAVFVLMFELKIQEQCSRLPAISLASMAQSYISFRHLPTLHMVERPLPRTRKNDKVVGDSV